MNLRRYLELDPKGVLPLGTGNDLARVLGWGSVCDDDSQLPQLLEKYERATTKLLDRWSILTYEGILSCNYIWVLVVFRRTFFSYA